MKYVKTGLYGLSIALLIQFCREIVIKLTGNLNFTTPNPTLLAITAAINNLELAYEKAANGGTLLTQDMYAKQQVLLDLMKLLAAYVQNASGGDEGKILSSGFGVRSTNHASVEVSAPDNLKARPSALPGNVDLSWKKVDGNKMYVVQLTSVADAQTGWATIGLVTKTRFIAVGLIAGHKYWFRVAAQNSTGQSPYSDVVQQMVVG